MGCVSNDCGIVVLTRWGLVKWGLGKEEGEDERHWGGIGGDACRTRKGFMDCGLKKGSMEGNRDVVHYG